MVLVDEQERYGRYHDIEYNTRASISERVSSTQRQLAFQAGLMGKDYRTEDGAQVAPLSELKDFQYPKVTRTSAAGASTR